MRKYTAGGRCDGGQTSKIKEDTQGVSTAFSELLEKRKALDSIWVNPPTLKTDSKGNSNTVQSRDTTIQIFKPDSIEQRKKDINLLLED